MHAIAEVRVMHHIGRDDAMDVLVLVRLQPGGDEANGRAAVRIGGDLRYRYERRSRWIEPAPQTAARWCGWCGSGQLRLQRLGALRRRLRVGLLKVRRGEQCPETAARPRGGHSPRALRGRRAGTRMAIPRGTDICSRGSTSCSARSTSAAKSISIQGTPVTSITSKQ